ncbi:MAG TPA: hypothetical protein VJO13_05400 [Ktedonobacterales bacterium]|nr:hypothetical protein [Ktedonobacterales bacterium]
MRLRENGVLPQFRGMNAAANPARSVPRPGGGFAVCAEKDSLRRRDLRRSVSEALERATHLTITTINALMFGAR